MGRDNFQVSNNSELRCKFCRRFHSLDELGGCFPATFTAGESALERVFEGLAEVAIKVCVNQRIQGAVEVPYPKKDGHHCFGKIACLSAERSRQVPEKKIKNNKLDLNQ